ncbi:MAG: hypothetical protein ACYC7L_02465 [Nitrospirota bacterium]
MVPLVLFFGLSFGISNVSHEAAAGESFSGDSLKLEWESEAPGRVVKVVNGQPKRISFRIRTGEHVARIQFGISRKDRSIGITISPEEVAVHEGIAGSIAVFSIPRGMPLGRHNLAIRVTETGTDRLIGTGVLPFILLPSGLDCMC